MKKIIYFDIDDTLISKQLLAQAFVKEIAIKTKLSTEKVIEIEDLYLATLESTTDFKPGDLMRFITLKTGTDYRELMEILKNKNIYKNALFPETMAVLESLKNDYRLGTYSQGFEDFQMRKLTLSGIIDYFDTELLIIERRKIAPEIINKIIPESIIVEDKKDVIMDLKNHDEFRTVWINRFDDEKIEGIKTIKNLTEVVNY